jgi:hypothetical protein
MDKLNLINKSRRGRERNGKIESNVKGNLRSDSKSCDGAALAAARRHDLLNLAAVVAGTDQEGLSDEESTRPGHRSPRAVVAAAQPVPSRDPSGRDARSWFTTHPGRRNVRLRAAAPARPAWSPLQGTRCGLEGSISQN